MKRTVLSAAIAVLALGMSGQCLAQQETSPAPGITPKFAPLLLAVLQPFLQTIIQTGADKIIGASQGVLAAAPGGDVIGGAFTAAVPTLIRELNAEAQRRLGAGTSGSSQQPPSGAYAYAPQIASPAQPSGQKPAISPGFTYTVDLLDANTPANVIGRIPLDKGLPTIHTGDRMAIRFMANLPGLVIIENIDANKVNSPLGIYPVFPGADSRVPRDLNKGIRMYGSTGIETFRVNYYPCVTDEARSRLGAQVGTLGIPNCPALSYSTPQPTTNRPAMGQASTMPSSTTPAPTAPPSTSTAQSPAAQPVPQVPAAASIEYEQISGKGGRIVSRAALNEEIVGQNTAVTVATSYQPGQAIVQQFQLNHIPAGQ